jgi:hypothetical protein
MRLERLEVSNAICVATWSAGRAETIPAAGGKDPRPQPFAMACWCRAANAGKLAPTVLARAEGCVSEAFHRLEHLGGPFGQVASFGAVGGALGSGCAAGEVRPKIGLAAARM